MLMNAALFPNQNSHHDQSLDIHIVCSEMHGSHRESFNAQCALLASESYRLVYSFTQKWIFIDEM